MSRRGGGRGKYTAAVFTKGAQCIGHLQLEKGSCFEFPGYPILSAGATTRLKHSRLSKYAP